MKTILKYQQLQEVKRNCNELQRPNTIRLFTVEWTDTAAVMVWVHKSISNRIDRYKLWNDRVIEPRLITQRGHLTILGVHAAREGREELNEGFYETLQKALDAVNKNDYTMVTGDMNNVTVRNNRVANIVGTNGEATLISNGKKTERFTHI